MASARTDHLCGMDHEAERHLEPLLGVPELAEYLGVPVQTIYDWRLRGIGPPAYRFGKRIKFTVSDVRAWVEQQRDAGSPDAPSGEGR